MTDVSIERITDRDAFDALAGEWDAFVAGLGPEAYFARHVFARANLDISLYRRGDRIAHLLFRKQGRLIGIAPLLLRSGPPGLRSWVWTESRTSFYAVFPVDPAHEDEVFGALLDYLLSEPLVRKLRADFVPEGTALSRFFSSIGARQVREFAALGRKLDAEVLPSLSRKRRSTVRRLRRRLEEQGHLEFTIADGIEDSLATLDWIIDRKIEQFDREEGAWIAWPETRRYLTDTVRALFPNGGVRLGEMRLDGRLIAASLYFIDCGNAWFSKTAYDPEYSEYSPGWMDLTWNFEELRQQGVRDVDLMVGEGLVKSTLATTRTLVHMYRKSLNPLVSTWRSLQRDR